MELSFLVASHIFYPSFLRKLNNLISNCDFKGETPFHCRHCNKGFRDKAICMVHEKSKQHENDRKYKCKFCPRAFTSAAGLNVHQV